MNLYTISPRYSWAMILLEESFLNLYSTYDIIYKKIISNKEFSDTSMKCMFLSTTGTIEIKKYALVGIF